MIADAGNVLTRLLGQLCLFEWSLDDNSTIQGLPVIKWQMPALGRAFCHQ